MHAELIKGFSISASTVEEDLNGGLTVCYERKICVRMLRKKLLKYINVGVNTFWISRFWFHWKQTMCNYELERQYKENPGSKEYALVIVKRCFHWVKKLDWLWEYEELDQY